MKYIKILHNSLSSLMALIALLSIASCSSEETVSSGTQQEHEGVGLEAVVKPFEMDGSRSNLTFSTSGMAFTWDASDVLTVFAKDNNQSLQQYTLLNGAQSNKANFSSANFQLTEGTRYFAVGKIDATAGGATTIPSQDNIVFDYEGQHQVGNGSTAHLGAYDYIVSSAKCEKFDYIHMDFSHLGSTLRMMLSVDLTGKEGDEATEAENAFKDTEFTSIEIYDSGEKLRQLKRPFAFSDCMNGDTYAPAWPSAALTGTEHFTVSLQGDGGGSTPETGIKPTDARRDGTAPTLSNANPYRLVSYIELPPVDWTGETIGIILRGRRQNGFDGEGNPKYDDVTYTGSYTQGFNVIMGKTYQINVKMKQSTDFRVSLKVNYNWQYGNAVTRSAGDPGYRDGLEKPTKIYYVFCLDGKVKSVNDKAYNTATANWQPTGDPGVDVHADKFTITVADEDKDKKKHVYFVTSTSDLTSSFSGLAAGTDESTVQALTYSLTAGTYDITNALDGTQTFLRDLYSTPWTDHETFVGTLKAPYYDHDVTVYHTAAKVDLQWDSPTPVGTASQFVTVSNVPNTALSLFTPTNLGGSSVTDGGYSVQAALGARTYLGFQVFYLPQYSNYSVKVGTKDIESTGFSPTTTNGYTSWLRWMKKYQSTP